MTNQRGKLLDFVLRPGNEHEMKSVVELLGDLSDKVILADKAYDSDELRELIEKEGGVAMIPPKSNRKREIFYLPEIGKMRHVVENFFSRVKRYRRINTRYDRLSETYSSFVYLASIMDWIR